MTGNSSAAERTDEQRALDAEFTLDTIADLPAVRARREDAARSADQRFKSIRDIPYGDDPAQTLDLYPAAQSSAPVQIFVHGGFWSTMRAAEFSFLADGFIPFGSALIIIDYPLIPTVRMADIVKSCQKAVAWTFQRGAEYGLDSDHIFISGNSAGGHLVAELMDRRWMRDAGLPTDAIKGGCAISGLFDLAPVAASFRNELLQFTPDDVARFSPLKRPIDIGAPLIVTVGGRETNEFLRQSADYAKACRAAGANVEHMIVDETDHITVVLDAFADPRAALNKAVRRQMSLLG